MIVMKKKKKKAKQIRTNFIKKLKGSRNQMEQQRINVQ